MSLMYVKAAVSGGICLPLRTTFRPTLNLVSCVTARALGYTVLQDLSFDLADLKL